MTAIKKYVKIWLLLAMNSFHTQTANSLGSAGFFIGKLVRFGFFITYLLGLFKYLPNLKGYSMPQVVLFFMTFNLIDIGGQFLFRGLYGVKTLVEEGDFDKILTQPVHALFRISSMGVDLLDLLTLVPVLAMTAWTFTKLDISFFSAPVLMYALMLLNAMVMTYAFHVMLGALSVRTQEFESAIWVYRDMMALGRFPVSIYSEPLRWFLLTVLPVGVLVSFPAQALLGLLSGKGILYAMGLGIFLHFVAQTIWKNSLREYTSISS